MAKMIRLEYIIEELRSYMPDADFDMIYGKPMPSPQRCHKGQKRVSGEPYLSHPLEVANILTQMKLGHVSVSVGSAPRHGGGLCDTTTEEIEELFGDEVAQIVEGVTKLSLLAVFQQGRTTGRKFPEDDPGHEQGFASHPDQAGRQNPQYAHAEFFETGEAESYLPRKLWIYMLHWRTGWVSAGSKPSLKTPLLNICGPKIIPRSGRRSRRLKGSGMSILVELWMM